MARTTNGVVMSLGTVNMWGFSPSFDLQRDLDSSKLDVNNNNNNNNIVDDQEPSRPVSFLLLDPGDIRHVLHTIANRRQHDLKRPLHFYVHENSIEVLARHLLLLAIAYDWELPLRQRCNLFLEVFGNALVQERTSEYIQEKARQLMTLVHDDKGFLADIVDLSHLKMRHRDDLVDTFASWFTRVPFNIQTLRDHRLRHYYETRYDYRNNLIDWDYTMSLKKIEQASVIHIKQYREWRNTGIAFEFGDQQYTIPNRSMAAYSPMQQRGRGTVLCRGLWSDILISPFISFGVNCEATNGFAKQLFEIHNKGTGVEQNRHNTAEVAVFNILSFLYPIETAEPYQMRKAHDVYSGIGEAADSNEHDKDQEKVDEKPRVEQILDEEEQKQEQEDVAPTTNQSELLDKVKEQDARQRARTILESLKGVKIILLTNKVESLYPKKRYSGLFDHVYLSFQTSHLLNKRPEATQEDPSLLTMLDAHATVSVESSTFLFPLTIPQRLLYFEKMLEMTTTLHLKPLFKKSTFTQEDLLQMDHAVLKFQRKAHTL